MADDKKETYDYHIFNIIPISQLFEMSSQILYSIRCSSLMKLWRGLNQSPQIFEFVEGIGSANTQCTAKHTAGVVGMKLFAKVPEVEEIFRHLKLVELGHLTALTRIHQCRGSGSIHVWFLHLWFPWARLLTKTDCQQNIAMQWRFRNTLLNHAFVCVCVLFYFIFLCTHKKTLLRGGIAVRVTC